MINSSKMIQIEIESEGDVNGFFKIEFEDGKKMGGWSCDQGSIEMDEDDQELTDDQHSILFHLWNRMDIPDNDYDHRFFTTFIYPHDDQDWIIKYGSNYKIHQESNEKSSF